MGLQDFPKGRVETRDTKLNAVGGGGGVLSTLGPTRKAGTGGGGGGGGAARFRPDIVSSPDPDSQQLRVDYITATWKVGLGNKNDALVPRVPQSLCTAI